MRRFLILSVALALGAGLLQAQPALADHSVSIDFPGTVDDFYSPFHGPATITITVDPADDDATFSARLRQAGTTTIIASLSPFAVHHDDADGVVVKSFTWPAISVNSLKEYEVVVRRGTKIVAVENFFLYPKLVSITSIKPNPFLPLIDDGVKDNTRVTFNLQTDADTQARVYRAKSNGTCCGTLIRTDMLNNLSSGSNEWVWDGKTDGSNEAGLGSYYVRIWADDGVVAPSVSAPKKVTISRYYRKTGQLQKSATAYHHVGPVTSYLRGGNCFLTNAQTDLWITCLHAKFTIYWRWSLPNGGRIEGQSWTFIPVSGDICKYTKGHTTTDSWMRAGTTSGQVRCRIDLAKVTYSYLQPS